MNDDLVKTVRRFNWWLFASWIVAFVLLVAICVLRTVTDIEIWGAILLMPGGLAMGAAGGFLYALAVSDGQKIAGAVIALIGVLVGASIVDVARDDSLLARLPGELAAGLGLFPESASLAIVMVIPFVMIGFLAVSVNGRSLVAPARVPRTKVAEENDGEGTLPE